jgi:hypothetical protein
MFIRAPPVTSTIISGDEYMVVTGCNMPNHNINGNSGLLDTDSDLGGLLDLELIFDLVKVCSSRLWYKSFFLIIESSS